MSLSTYVFVLQIHLVLHILLLLQISGLKFFFLLLDFYLSTCLKLFKPFVRLFSFFNINWHFNFFSSIRMFGYFSGTLKDAVVFRWQVVLLGFVVKSKIMLFTLIRSFRFDILLRNIYPIAHTAFHNSLN
jgi:hypothetical protein